MLVDHEIRNLCQAGVVKDYLDENIQPVSLDVRLSSFFSRVQPLKEKCIIDPLNHVADDVFEKVDVGAGTYFLHPGAAVLGSTVEYVDIPDDVLCEVHGKSSLGRLFLIVHATAGLVDPGFKGHITLEIVNHSACAIILTPGMPIAQLTFMPVNKCSNPYNGKYQNQDHAIPSRYHLNKIPS